MDTINYFKSREDYFWQWEEGGEVVALSGGSTICYREQLITLLTAMSHDGIPRLGSLLLVLAAMNPQPDEILRWTDRLLDAREQKENELRQPVFALLRLVSELPRSYKEGMGKVETLRALFRGCHNAINTDTAGTIINEFRNIRFQDGVYTRKGSFRADVMYTEFNVIALLAQKFKTVDDIKNRIAGLPKTPATLVDLEDEQTNEPPKEKDFVEELILDPQTFPVGTLVRRIWSGLNIPFHNLLPSEQPMGGVSDITNKGDFHRLLTTEFANDDVTFLSRLANNEALYINREIPPQSNKKERVVLIDVSLHNWGTPKTIAYALLVAIARHPKTDIPCSAYAVGDTYTPIRFETVDDIISSMREVAGCLHPGKGLRRFFEDFQRKRNMEVIFISNPDTMKKPGLSVAVQDYLSLFRFWMLADQEGNVDLFRNQQNTRKHHQHFQLPLEELWKPRPSKRKASAKSSTSPTTDYPILFPGCPFRRDLMIAPDDSCFLIGKDNCIYLVNAVENTHKAPTGWERIYESLLYASGKVVIGQNDDGEYIVFAHSQQQKRAIVVNLNTKETNEFAYTPDFWSQYPEYFFHNGSFHLLTKSKCRIISTTGELSYMEYKDYPLEELTAAYTAMKEKALARQRFLPHAQNYLKNVSQIGVTASDDFIINKHALVLKQERIYWEPLHVWPEFECKSVRGRNHFLFEGNYSVTNTESGMLVLENPSGEKIYIPTAIELTLGLATHQSFSGNMFYFKQVEEKQQMLSPSKFWELYIAPFIKGIQANAVRDKA